MSPLSNTDDPVVREVRRLRNQVKRLALASAVLYGTLAIAIGLALYLRSADLEDLATKADSNTVHNCFRNANQRPGLLAVASDPDVALGVRDFVLTVWENSPTVFECRQLAKTLNVPVVKEITG